MKFIRWFSWVALTSAILASSAHANDDWWFDVEVIAFKRNASLSELEEQFTLANTLSAPRADVDVIRDIIAPDISWLKQGLRQCNTDTRPSWSVNPALVVPQSDVDFLSLPSLSESEDVLAEVDIKDSETSDAQSNTLLLAQPSLESTEQQPLDATSVPEESISATASANNTEAQEVFEATVQTINSDLNGDTLNTENDSVTTQEDLLLTADASDSLNDETPAPSAATIAQYWLSFFGADSSSGKQPLFGSEEAKNTSPQVPEFSYCETAKPWLTVVEKDNDIVWKAEKADNRLPVPASLPIIIEGHDWPRASHAHLLSSEQQSLTSISRQIRSNRELERLFHATWRQPVAFGKDNAFNVRLYGGRNYSDEYELSGEQRPKIAQITLSELQNISAIDNLFSGPANLDSTTSVSLTGAEEVQTNVPAQQIELNDGSQGQNTNTERPILVSAPDIFSTLEQKLSTPAPIPFEAFKALDLPEMFDDNDDSSVSNALRTPIWEIDGTMKVFLKYINRVPYLHIDSALFYRQPVPLSYFSNSDIDAINQTIALNTADNDNGAATEVEYRLASVPLAEQRRVISTQLHYFDHPLFGFIVQIRRYQRPALEETEQ
jgi:hypothetical protein